MARNHFQEHQYRYGLLIGEAYQIADDLQEVKAHLSARPIHPEQMMALTPALLHFVGAMRPYITSVLKGEFTDLRDQPLKSFRVAETLMQNEIEHRLQSAVSLMEKNFPI